MYAWEQIQITIDYIEKHLHEEITIEQLSKIAALSPFYYQRLFRRLVTKPVIEYIKLRRLAKATETLLQTDERILDIALDLGFSSHEHFTRTFKDTFGMTPEEYRKQPVALNRMTKPELSLQYTYIEEGVPLITEGIVLEINRVHLNDSIIFNGLNMELPIDYVNDLGKKSGVDPIDALWNRFHTQKETVFHLPIDDEEIGAIYPCSKDGYFSYFAGARSYLTSSNDDSKSWILPDGEYVVCSFEAENFKTLVMDALYKAEQYIYNIWLPKQGLKTDVFCAERYASHSPETKQMEVWLRVLQ